MKTKQSLKRKAQKALRRKKSVAQKRRGDQQYFYNSRNGQSIPAHILKNAYQYPIHACLMNEHWPDFGLAVIVIVRKTPIGLLLGQYLVDTFCLGLKNTIVTSFASDAEYHEYVLQLEQGFGNGFQLKECGYEQANSVVYGGIMFAKQLGFPPQKDFALSRHILGPEIRIRKKLQFGGKNGKPIYVCGPYDNQEEIMRKLTEVVGADGFEYVLGFEE